MKPLSIQQRWQRRMVAQGRCRQCGGDANGKHHCANCLALQRSAYYRRRDNTRLYNCGACGQQGHNARTCPERGLS